MTIRGLCQWNQNYQLNVYHSDMTDWCIVSGLSKEEAAASVLRGQRLGALGLKALTQQCETKGNRVENHNSPTLQHATQEALVGCIQALIGMTAPAISTLTAEACGMAL